MKRFLYLVSIVVLTSLIPSACNIPVSPTATSLPVVTEPPAATVSPAITQESTATELPIAALVSIDIAGPLMEVGSKYQYVDGTILVAVPGGPFTMGYNSADNPIHEVTLSEFWIYSTKVTNQQYALCVQSGKCTPPDADNDSQFGDYEFINFPVTGVNYAQAAEYCTFVHGRLPTEAEWEKVARGPDGNLFPWGDAAPACRLLNYKFCQGKTTAVNDYHDGVSFYGAFDMSGNVREWAADWYSPTYYSESPVEDPLGPELGEKRSVRGSSYEDSADPSISAHRFSLIPTDNLPDLGFRCIVEDPTYFAPLCEQLAYIGIGPKGEEASCTPNVQCNDVGISQAPNCTGNPGYVAYTIVTFDLADTPPIDWVYEVPGCSQLPGEDKFQCDLPGPYTAKVEGTCTDTKLCVSACPLNYTKDGDVCKWTGGGTIGTDCIAGTTYDPLTQCCAATPGAAVDFGICPAGYYPLGSACVENPDKVEETVIQDVLFDNKCSPPIRDGGDDVPACSLDANICGQQKLLFCAADCSCKSRTAPCP